MEVRLGNIFGFSGGNYAGNVYDKDFLAPTLNTMQGGCKQPMIVDASAIRMVRTEEGKALRKEYESGAIHHGFNEHREMELRTDGVSNTLSTVQKDNYICEKTIVAMRGRNPDNPSDRTVGSPKEQRLEPNSQGIAFSHNGSGTFGVIETYSPYVNQKYEEFFEENGYVPEYFNPYNKTELTDIAPALTAQGESVTKSSTVLKCETQYRIRKLTPLECWRLMYFTDEDFEKAAKVNSNTQLYKQAGNSIVKNVLVAILGQMIPGKEDVYKEINESEE